MRKEWGGDGQRLLLSHHLLTSPYSHAAFERVRIVRNDGHQWLPIGAHKLEESPPPRRLMPSHLSPFRVVMRLLLQYSRQPPHPHLLAQRDELDPQGNLGSTSEAAPTDEDAVRECVFPCALHDNGFGFFGAFLVGSVDHDDFALAGEVGCEWAGAFHDGFEVVGVAAEVGVEGWGEVGREGKADAVCVGALRGVAVMNEMSTIVTG